MRKNSYKEKIGNGVNMRKAIREEMHKVLHIYQQTLGPGVDHSHSNSSCQYHVTGNGYSLLSINFFMVRHMFLWFDPE